MNMNKRIRQLMATSLTLVAIVGFSQPTVQAESNHSQTYQQFSWNEWTLWWNNSFYLHQPTQKAQPTETQQPVAAPQPEVTPIATPAPAPAPAPTPSTQPVKTETEQASETGLTAVEHEVVRLVNIERSKYGLSPLKASSELSAVARDKSQDMRDRQYFDHQSPTYGSPFDMMNAYGIHYMTAGENIAAGQQTAQEVVTAWMNSEGHRKNILNSNFNTIGVGYVTGGSYQHYWTQMFTG